MVNKHKDILEDSGEKVFLIFFKDWQSKKEASIEYDSEFMNRKSGRRQEYRNHPTVMIYFNKFIEKGYLEEDKITKIKVRERNGKKHQVPNTCLRYKSNLKPFFDKFNILNEKDRTMINFIFNDESYRNKIIFLCEKENKSFYEAVKKVLLDIASYSLLMHTYEESLKKKSINNITKKPIIFTESDFKYIKSHWYDIKLGLENYKLNKLQKYISNLNSLGLIEVLPYSILIKIFRINEIPFKIFENLIPSNEANSSLLKNKIIKEQYELYKQE